MPPALDLATLTFTRRLSEPSVLTYPHGYSVRVALVGPLTRILEALGRMEWSPQPRKTQWRVSAQNGVTRYDMTGSAWLTGRRPRDKRRMLARSNVRWGTDFYNVRIEVGPDAVTVDLQGVRARDLQALFEGVMGLGPEEYRIAYWRVAERYIVLRPADALRLAAALGGTARHGRGRMNGNKWLLLADFPVPVVVRSRTKATAEIAIYRVERGPTYAYKCEVRLRAAAASKQTFSGEDHAALDQVLLTLVSAYDLHPCPKPALWEPAAEAAAPARAPAPVGGERFLFDRSLQRLGRKVWCGRRPDERALRPLAKSHPLYRAFDGPRGRRTEGLCSDPGITPSFRDLLSWEEGEEAREESAPPSKPVFPQEAPFSKESGDHGWVASQGEPEGIRLYVRSVRSVRASTEDAPCALARPTHPLPALAEEVALLRGALVEIVVEEGLDPGPVVRALCEQGGSGGSGRAGDPAGPRVGVGLLTLGLGTGDLQTYRSVQAIAEALPLTDATERAIVVADEMAEAWTEDATVSEEGGGLGFAQSPTASWSDPQAATMVAMTAAYAPAFRLLRRLVEAEGSTAVFVTVDRRPDIGRGALTPGNFYRDDRVRSLFGDASRYYCHARYRVERGAQGQWRVVVLKDGAEGKMGRLVGRGGDARIARSLSPYAAAARWRAGSS